MNRFGSFPTLLVAALLVGCNVSVDSGGQRFSGGGVTFIVPLQTSRVTNGPFGIDYKSENLTASTDGTALLVNGKQYGSLTTGDIVDFTDPGIVKVNGASRAASTL